MANSIQYADIFQSNLDKLIVAEATSTFMEANPHQIKYNGGKTIKIADIVLTGLKDYDREAGFASGDVTLTWTDYTLTQDRGITFQVDAMDVDESANMATAATVVSEFGRTQVVPEIDAYRYATIVTNSATNENINVEAAPTDADAFLKSIRAAFAHCRDMGMETSNLVLLMTPANKELLEDSQAFQRLKNTTTIRKGDVDYNVDAYRETPIVEVPSGRFTNKFTKKAGGGFDSNGNAINFILMPASGAATAIVKTDKIRIFAPDVNQKADAYKIDVRVYHDVILPKNAGKQIHGSISA